MKNQNKKGIKIEIESNDFQFMYRGVNVETGEIIFKAYFSFSTEQVTEYIATVHALMYYKKNMMNGSVYCNSQQIKNFIETKTIKHNLELNEVTNELIHKIDKCDRWVAEQKNLAPIEIIKTK